MGFSDIAGDFRKLLDREKPAAEDAALSWESEMGQAYEGLLKNFAYRDLHDNILTLRDGLIEEMVAGSGGDDTRKAIQILGLVLKLPTVRIEQGREARRVLEEGNGYG